MKAPHKAASIGPIMLSAIVISSMIGGGTYSIPQSMAQNGVPAAIILAWLVTAVGMFFIAFTFKILSEARPNLTTGIYAYSRDGFGDLAGFGIAWSYWICQICGNIGSLVLAMSAMNYFFPGQFYGGNNVNSIIGGSAILWLMFFIVRDGIKSASLANLVGTVCKVLPIAAFMLVAAYYFDFGKFMSDFAGQVKADNTADLGGLGSQTKNLMIYAMWTFVGIEGAVVMSGRARSQRDVGIATLVGFFGCVFIFVTISLLPFGLMTQEELSKIENPSTAGVLKAIAGDWGEVMMNVGLLVSICASMLSWTMIVIQIPFAAAKDGTFPKFFSGTNAKDVPIKSLIVTTLTTQAIFIMVHFAANAWNTIFTIASVLVLPAYFATAAYLVKISLPKKNVFHICCGIFGSAYALWVIYSAGLNYLLLASIFIAAGIPIFLWTRKQDETRTTRPEYAAIVAVAAIALVAAFLWIRGGAGIMG